MYRKSGSLFVSLYLKQCAVALQTSRGSNTAIDRNLSVPVSLNASGLPRIIPSFHRKEILRGSARGDALIKFDLSLFTLNR